MSRLLQGLTKHGSFTENGAPSNSSTNSPVLDLFFLAGGSRELSKQQIVSKLSLAYNTDKELTTKLIFWAGDIREGIGERRFFKICLNWLWENHKEVVIQNLENIPFFNRYDSMFTLHDSRVYDFLYNKLKNGDGLCGKWMPRKQQFENYSDKFRRHFKLSPKAYRKLLVGATKVVENKMCKKEFGDINYAHVPSVAFKKYRKAFKKRDEERFTKFLEDAKEGKTKIHASAIFPHDIIKEYMKNRSKDRVLKEAINQQWNNLPNLVKTSEKILPVCDVSESMYDEVGSIHVSIALGIYFSERNEGIFKDSFITFSRDPELHTLKGSVCDRVDQMGKLIAYNTDLRKVFELILNTAKREELSQEDMPDKILLLSDMEFDNCCGDVSLTNFEMIDKMYRDAGYKRPDIIFWNINSSSTKNYPVQQHQTGAALVSGCSPNIIKSVLSGTLSPLNTMLDTLNSERYNVVKI